MSVVMFCAVEKSEENRGMWWGSAGATHIPKQEAIASVLCDPYRTFIPISLPHQSIEIQYYIALMCVFEKIATSALFMLNESHTLFPFILEQPKETS